MVPQTPFTKWTEIAPTGSSILATRSKNSTEKTTRMPETTPMMAAPTGETQSHPAVMATRPAREALKVMETSGLPYRHQVKIIVTTVAMAAARFVFMKTREAEAASSAVLMATVEPPLNPNQQNQRMKTPRATAVMLWPRMALGLPFLSYLPMRGPRSAAPRQAIRPPTLWTCAEPAKSWKPRVESQPPPQLQCPQIG